MFGDIMRQAQAFQEKLAKIQEEAAKKMIEVSSGGGMVTVVANGRQEIMAIKIDPEVMKSGDVEMQFWQPGPRPFPVKMGDKRSS